ncbi:MULTISPECIES: class I adenylate cyclase [Photobacterium]|uniref:Adenylate cyclase n=1 Tax=Photobacterium ganghwense TaxID=320778 RepID=A0A0J1H2S5_9GAMM|nr:MULTISPECIES: class I adenylate cyclase [Photobacterium]KLV06075.1 adenylate cyclase [Photobacterium ganghwense]MBV1839921.1 class I adenylate cyclase [Photobacterium ganghwense]PSU04993.1 class I adenylate cyclase [Photobacterium ganghwense]QSV14030.1 class I adenylate cyclase [Photobacterium ganghwense]
MQNFITTLNSRLEQLNKIRLERACGAMTAQSEQVFNLLPVLLHYNHPAVPGYLDQTVPVGIASFTASPMQQQLIDDCALACAATVTPPDASTRLPILGLYSMGSTASLGQSLTSDLDIWVVIRTDLPSDARSALEAKCALVSEWALVQGVEANFFLIDENRFLDNFSEEMTGENCGSSQHLLLLDEFYRSAVRLAGLSLLWFMVPPEMEECYDDYIRYLEQGGFIRRDEWIDFGGLSRIPAEEYFGSSLWQLYKSIDSPYKSVLKAILLEAYSWEYPHTQLLSVDGKRRFFAIDRTEFCMDAYYLMLEKVTRYLQRINDHRRLDLVRRCFYLKTHEKLTRQPASGSVPWRRKILEELTANWQWSEEVLLELDSRRDWKVEQVKRAHNELLDALMLSYRNLIRFARRNNITSAISPEDISILARKLYAAFEVLPGKVTLLNPQLSPDLHEQDLTFIQVPAGRTNAAGWYLYKQSLDPVAILGRASLEHNRYLSKLVAWAYFNGLLTESTCLHSVVRTAAMDIDKLYQLVSDIRNTFPIRRPQPSLQALSSPCEIRQLGLFINLENDPTTELKSRAVRFDFKNTDIFSYGPEQLCLVGSVDLVYRNSWNEVRTLNFTGENAMLDALKTVLGKMHQDALPPESVDVFCYSKHMRGLIRNLVYQLVAECIEMRLKPVEQEKRRRFKAIRIGSQTHGLFFERRGVSVQKLENSVDFYSCISSNKLIGSASLVMGKTDEPHPPEIVDAYASEGLIQFFFEDCADGFNIYILDETNRIEVYRQCSGDKDEMVHGVNRFYTSAHERFSYSANFINFNLPQFYDIVRGDNGETQVLPFKSGQQPTRRPAPVMGGGAAVLNLSSR